MNIEIPADYGPVVQRLITEGRFRDEEECGDLFYRRFRSPRSGLPLELLEKNEPLRGR